LQALRADRTGALLRMTPAGEITTLLGRAVVRRRPGIAGAAAVGMAAAIGTAGAVAATSYNWGWGGTSSDHALYFKNLRDAGYNPKDNFNANGTIKSQ
jgi:hypothetical protein